MRGMIRQGLVYGSGLLVAVLLCERSLFASIAVAAPEIDASSVSIALGALAAGVLILRARSRSK